MLYTHTKNMALRIRQIQSIRQRVFLDFMSGLPWPWFSLIQFINSICIAQLIRMSHCGPEATLKPKRFQFTPKIFNVFVAQVQATGRLFQPVPWQQQSFCHQMFCVFSWNSARSVGGRAKPTSWTFPGSFTRAQYDRLLPPQCRLSVCLSVTKCIVANYWLNDTFCTHVTHYFHH